MKNKKLKLTESKKKQLRNYFLQSDNIDFGELTVARKYAAGCSTYKRGVAMGGLLAPGNSNVIDFIEMASAGDATDFGDLTVARGHLGFNGISNGHGGLS